MHVTALFNPSAFQLKIDNTLHHT